MADSPCYTLAKELKAAIDARLAGRQVNSAAHKGRSVQYSQTPIKELIAYYNQVRASCQAALADPDLIYIAPLDQPAGTRGRPAVFSGRSYC